MYRKKDKSKQTQLQILCIEDLVPKDHMLREIESAIDWSFIYEEVKGLYKEAEWGNPGIDPVVLFKIVFIQYHLYGNRSYAADDQGNRGQCCVSVVYRL